MDWRDGYTCMCCGEWKDGAPMAHRTAAPDYWSDEFDGRDGYELTSDLCVINDEHFFIHGNINIPVIGTDESFQWGVWGSLSAASFRRTLEIWETVGRESEPSQFSWLSTALPYEPTTVNLKMHVHTAPVGIRPHMLLEPTDHPLAVEQRDGITVERVREIAAEIHARATGRA